MSVLPRPRGPGAWESLLHHVCQMFMSASRLVFSPLQTPAVLTGNGGVRALDRKRRRRGADATRSCPVAPHCTSIHAGLSRRMMPEARGLLPLIYRPCQSQRLGRPRLPCWSPPAEGTSSSHRATRITQRDDWTPSCWGTRLSPLLFF